MRQQLPKLLGIIVRVTIVEMKIFRQTPVTPNPQPTVRNRQSTGAGQPSNVRKAGRRRVTVLAKQQVIPYGYVVKAVRNLAVQSDAVERITEDETPVLLRIIERLHAEMITRTE